MVLTLPIPATLYLPQFKNYKCITEGKTASIFRATNGDEDFMPELIHEVINNKGAVSFYTGQPYFDRTGRTCVCFDRGL